MHSQLDFVPRLRLSVLEGVRVQTGRDIVGVTGEAQRLLSFLALRDRAVPRSLVAGTLWPDVPESHSHSSLRSALARLEQHIRAFVTVEHTELGIAACVIVDLREGKALAQRLVDERNAPDEGDLDTSTVALLSGDLLPDRYEDWALTGAEEWRQLRLHALEALSGRLVVLERFGEAATAALAAIRVEPLRESARVALLRVHVGEGNQSEALREFARYAVLLHDELGLEPTSRLRALIDFPDNSAIHDAPGVTRLSRLETHGRLQPDRPDAAVSPRSSSARPR